jgi:hypothetical protein
LNSIIEGIDMNNLKYKLLLSLLFIFKLDYSCQASGLDPWADEQTLRSAFKETAESLVASQSIEWFAGGEEVHSGFYTWLDSSDELRPQSATCVCWELAFLFAHESQIVDLLKGIPREDNKSFSKEKIKSILYSGSSIYPSSSIIYCEQDEQKDFHAGDIIFINDYKHVVVATGEADTVYSLWDRPDDNRRIQKVSLAKLIETIDSQLPIKIETMCFEDFCSFLALES